MLTLPMVPAEAQTCSIALYSSTCLIWVYWCIPITFLCKSIRLCQHQLLSQVQDMLSKAQARYEEGDRYQALKLWEQALKQV